MNIMNGYQTDNHIPSILKILPIEGNVAFPNIIFPIIIHEDAYLKLIKDALAADKHIAVFTKKPSPIKKDKND